MLLERTMRSLDLDTSLAEIVNIPPERRAGFLAIRTSHAARLVAELRARDMFVDARGDTLRVGPAPYVSDQQLYRAVELLGEHLQNEGSTR